MRKFLSFVSLAYAERFMENRIGPFETNQPLFSLNDDSGMMTAEQRAEMKQAMAVDPDQKKLDADGNMIRVVNLPVFSGTAQHI